MPPTPATTPKTGVVGGVPTSSNSGAFEAGQGIRQVGESSGVVGREGEAALGIATAPFRNREITGSRRLYQQSARGGAGAQQSAAMMLALAAQLQGASPQADTLANRLKQRLVTFRRASERRQEDLATLTHDIRLSYFFVIFSAVVLAVVADVLSIWDFGWLIAWLIPVFTFFMSRRINKINKGAQRIGKAQEAIGRDVVVMQQRLRGKLSPEQRNSFTRNAALTKITGITNNPSSYLTRYLVETLIAQVLELIPVVDMLPLYCAEVGIVLFDQYNAYTKARGLLPGLQRTLASLEQLETFEVQSMTRELGIALGVYQQQLVANDQIARQLQQAPESSPQSNVLQFTPKAQPQSVRDISAPVSLPAAA